jgi:Tfp pilus assembly protein PilF
VLVRGVLVLIAAAAIVFGATRLHDVRACASAKREGFALALGKRVSVSASQLTRDVRDHCRASADLSATSVALARSGALAPAAQLAHAAIRRDPRGYLGWVALAIVLQHEHRPLAQRAAARRAVALNPRYGPAQELASGAPAAGAAGP